MTEIANSEGTSVNSNRLQNNDVNFPPFPEPTEDEFDEDIEEDERAYYRKKFTDLESVKRMRLHCSACDRHLGSTARNESRMRAHPMLRTLVCHTCHTFYNSGEFEKGDDGSELYCRWCGQGGQVYCCSDCPHVFCAKCIKRNLGGGKIKEIENTDDWKCFKCDSKCLWELRAVCWALLRYCDLKNKITYKTEDPALKEAYQIDCAIDYTECCKNKGRKREKTEPVKKKEEKKPAPIMPKVTAIQVKKFASINLDEPLKEKKAQKRPANDKVVVMKTPVPIAPPTPPSIISPIGMPPVKKPRMSLMNPVRFAAQQERKQFNTYQRIRPKFTMPIPIIPQQYNGFNMNNNTFNNYGNMVPNDTLNLSLESLTQGLDMAAVAAMTTAPPHDDDVVCTPDFPLEPLCEVTEENTDDDVQCITPGPVAAPKHQASPAFPRADPAVPNIAPDNIVQMTDNDVTVNALTGGLKFRVDPQTLSSNKMYRLPDGRIFAIKANPNMPGGYSATIVAVTEAGAAKAATKGATYAAKLSAVSPHTPVKPKTLTRILAIPGSSSKKSSPKSSKVSRGTDKPARECDLQVPVEWYRYNLIDAVDALEYSLHRLLKLKKDATCRYLRTRSVDEMKNLHRTLDRLLNTSATRFNEIKENLGKDLKIYIAKKTGSAISDDDDDDVEILPDQDDDDPIYIDENSVESNSNDLTCNEVDLTGVGSSDHNDSAEILSDNGSKIDRESVNDDNTNHFENITSEKQTDSLQGDEENEINQQDKNVKEDSEEKVEQNAESEKSDSVEDENKKVDDKNKGDNENKHNNEDQVDSSIGKNNEKDESILLAILKHETVSNENDGKESETETKEENKLNGNSEQGKTDEKQSEEQLQDDNNKKDDLLKDDEKNLLSGDNNSQDNDVKLEDAEMSEEMIENLLYEDSTDTGDHILKNKTMEVVESL